MMMGRISSGGFTTFSDERSVLEHPGEVDDVTGVVGRERGRLPE